MATISTSWLGARAPVLLEGDPLRNWPVERTVEEDFDEELIEYVFTGRGLEMHCDEDESVNTVFLKSDDSARFDQDLFDLRFSANRAQVVERLGPPSKSGEKQVDPVFGESGAWDRFDRPDHSLHVQYRTDADAVEMITLMRADVVP